MEGGKERELERRERNITDGGREREGGREKQTDVVLSESVSKRRNG